MKKYILTFIFLSFFFLALPAGAQAANLYWVGADGAATNVASNWKTTNPTGCGGGDAGAAPGTADVAIFDADCDNGAAITGTFDVDGVSIEAGYTGTITQNTVAMTIRGSGWTQAGGTFTGNSDGSTANITFQSGGDFSLSGGTFTATNDNIIIPDNWTVTGGTFNANSGTVTMTLSTDNSTTVNSSVTFYNLNLGSSGCFNPATITFSASTTNTVTNNLILSTSADPFCNDLRLQGTGEISLTGNLTVSGGGGGTNSIADALIINVNGTGDQNIFGVSSPSAEPKVPSINIVKTGGSLTLSDSISVTANWAYAATDTTFVTTGSTIYFYQGHSTSRSIAGTATYNNLYFGSCSFGSYSVTSGSTLTLTGKLTFDQNSSCNPNINGPGTFIVQGDIETLDGGASGNVTISLSGSGDQTLTQNGNSFPTGTVTFNKSGGSVNLATAWNLSGSGQDLLVAASSTQTLTGAFTLTVNDVTTIAGTLTQGTATIQSGTFSVSSGGVWNNASSGDIIIGTGGLSNSGGMFFTGSTGCGVSDVISITSTSGGAARTWSGSGAFYLTDVSLQDQTTSLGLTAYSSTNVSGNSGFTFNSNCPVATAHWKFDEGYGTVANDSVNDSADGTLSGSTLPAWKTEDLCISGKCLYFDGTTSYVSISGAFPQVKSIGFWVRPNSVTSTALVSLNDAAQTITATSGTIATSGITSPTIYVNGAVGTTLTANTWNYIEVVTNTAIDVGQILVGKSGSTFLQGFVDEVKIYDTARTASEVGAGYLARGTYTNPAAQFESPSLKSLSDGLSGYWKLNESSGNATDSSGNGYSLTNNGTTTYVGGKFGNGSEHVPASSQHFSTVSTINSVKSVSFWTNPDSTTNYYVSLTSGAYITSTSGTLSATGFTNPKIYVNGTQSTTIAADTWQLVTVTSDTAINADQFYIGRQGSNYFDGTMDEVRLYNRFLTPSEISQLYQWTPGPVAHYKFDENTGTASFYDSSGNGLTASGGILATVVERTGSVTVIQSNANTGSQSISAPSDATGIVVMTGGWESGNNDISAAGTVSWNGTSLGTYRHFQNDSADANATVIWAAQITDTGSRTFAWDREGSSAVDEGGAWFIFFVKGVDWSSPVRATGGQGSGGGGGTMTTGSMAGATGDLTVAIFVEFGTDAITWTGATKIGSSVDYNSDRHEIAEVAPTGSHTVSASGGQWVGLSAIVLKPGGTVGSGGTPTSGKFGAANTFSGNDTVITVNEAAPIDLGATTDSYSVGAWINTTTNGAGTAAVVAKNDGSGAYPYHLYLNSSEQACFQISDGTNSPSVCGSTALNNGAWHYLTGVRDVATDTLYLYVNGVLVNSANDTTTATTANDDKLSIGNSGTSYTANDFTGSIDDVKIYNYARTTKQVVEDMNAGHPAGGSPISSMIGYWKFDEQQGQTINDSGFGGNNGTRGVNSGSASDDPTWKVAGSSSCKVNGCLDFDGGDNVQVAASALLNPESDYSITAWIKPRTIGSNMSIYAQGSTASDTPFAYFRVVTTGAIGYSVRNDANTNVQNNSTIILSAGNWYHVGLTKTGNTYTLYVNGVGQQFTSTTPTTYTLNTTVIGAIRRTTTTQQFDGIIDEVKIYNSTLTPDEIKIDYNAGSAAALGGVLGANSQTGYAIDALSYDGSKTSLTQGSSQTSIYSTTATHAVGASYAPAPKKYARMDWTANASSDYVQALALFNPASTTTPMSVDATSAVAAWTTDQTSVSWSHTVGSGNNRLLAVAITNRDNTTDGDRVISGVTYNSVALTQAVSKDDTSASDNMRAEIWYLVNPDSGTNTVQVNFAGGGPTTGRAGAVSFAGASQTSPLDNTGGHNSHASATPFNVVATTSVPGAPPVGWWKFDENTGTTAYDSSGNDNTGTLNNMTASSWKPGQIGSALDFDADNDDVTAGTNTILDLNTTGTFMAWIKPRSSGESNLGTIFSRGAGSGAGYDLFFSSGNLSFWNGTETGGGIGLDTTRWYHIALSVNGSSTSWYVNGVPVSSTGITLASAGSATLYIGSFDGDTETFDGLMDDLKIYNYGLSPAQVRYEYDRGLPSVHLKFDECQGTTLYNSGSSRNNVPHTIRTYDGTWSGSSGGNTSAGTCGSGTSTEAWNNGTTGKRNASLDFDGTDDRVTITANDGATPFTIFDQRFTLSAWIKSDLSGTSNNSNIMTRQTSGQHGFELNITSGVLSLVLDNEGTPTTVSGRTNLNSGGATWYHIAATWDRTLNGGKITLFVNGVPDGQGFRASTGAAPWTDVSIGGYVFGGHFNGQIDDVRFYEYALSEDMIRQVYNNGAVFVGPVTGSP